MVVWAASIGASTSEPCVSRFVFSGFHLIHTLTLSWAAFVAVQGQVSPNDKKLLLKKEFYYGTQ